MAGSRKKGRRPQRRRSVSTGEATAAGRPWEFDGETWTLSPLTFKDFGLVNETMRSIVMARFTGQIDVDTPGVVADRMMREGYRASQRVDILRMGALPEVDPDDPAPIDPAMLAEIEAQQEMLALLTHPTVMAAIVWCSLRHEQRHLKRSEVADWFTATDLPALEDAVKLIFMLCGVELTTDTDDDDDDGESASGGEPATGEKFRSSADLPDPPAGGDTAERDRQSDVPAGADAGQSGPADPDGDAGGAGGQ